MHGTFSQLTRADLDFSDRLFSSLREQHYTPDGGVNRLAYTHETTWALRYLGAEAEKLGAKIYVDPAGDYYAIFEPDSLEDKLQPALLMGSHVDAVPQGGQYDGMMGVIAPLQAMAILKQQGIKLRQPVAIPMFVNEESSRWAFALSSKAAMGVLPPSVLDKRDDVHGETPLEAMKAQRIDVDVFEQKVRAREAFLPKEETAFFLETHIEQEDTLADEGFDIGIVTKAYGNYRPGLVRFEGRADHSGMCPPAKRRDAVLAASHFNVRLEARLNELNQTYAHLGTVVFALNKSNSSGGAQNIISADNEVLFDIRSDSKEMLIMARRIAEELATEIATERKVSVKINRANPTLQDPIEMDTALREGLSHTAGRLGLRYKSMSSGAGHDCMVLQENGIKSGALLTPQRGGSHHPLERMTVEAGDDPYDLKSGYASSVRMLMEYAQGKVVVTQRIEGPALLHRQSFTVALVARGAKPLSLAA